MVFLALVLSGCGGMASLKPAITSAVPEPSKVNLNETISVTVTGTDPYTQTFLENYLVTEPTVEDITGYRFDGWYTDDTYTTGWSFYNYPSTDLNLVAKWHEYTAGEDITKAI